MSAATTTNPNPHHKAFVVQLGLERLCLLLGHLAEVGLLLLPLEVFVDVLLLELGLFVRPSQRSSLSNTTGSRVGVHA